MTLEQKRIVIIVLSLLFLASLVFVQRLEVARRAEEAGITRHTAAVPATSKACVDCHAQGTPAIVAHWRDSTHSTTGVGCVDCHQANPSDADAFVHYGATIATVITPKDCARCHKAEDEEFEASHHAAAGNILASLDNFLAETVEGHRGPFNPHSPTPGKAVDAVNGMASAFSGCQQCHGSKVALQGSDGSMITVDQLKPDPTGKPTNLDVVAKIVKDENGKPKFHTGTWPNTGIGRLNLDGSRGSCSACHSRHDFSPRRARQPENCGKCHLGPDHPQKEIYEESKHGVAYRDLKDEMNLDAKNWVLGEDYTQAPTCATCHMSANTRNGRKVTHDPGERISWTNRPPISLVMDTDVNGKIVTVADPAERQKLVADTAETKRTRMKQVCLHCHTPDYVNGFYRQYDDLVILYNEKFAKPGKAIVDALQKEGLITPTQFDDKIEWTWYFLWHHEGRRARHGASMMAPDDTHGHGMFEVADRFYMELLPEARELTEKGGAAGDRVDAVIDAILKRPEHAWYQEGATDAAEKIRAAMQERYGQGKVGN
ncbi:MAG: multiheme c-type cytochrome [Thermoanaerobaculia bacterium]|nr:multiheme c-type cytochrome [Thermoanaerobaculia bacterium]